MIPNDMTYEGMSGLHNACFAQMRPWSAAEIADLLHSEHSFYLSRDKAFLIGRAVAGEAEIITLAVDPSMRRIGLGRELTLNFMAVARQNGASRAFLEVAADNAPAIALYHSVGFVQAGLRRTYYQLLTGEAVDALVLTCPLTVHSAEI